MRLDSRDERVADLLQAWGIAYSYGAGAPKDAAHSWPPDPLPHGIGKAPGLDCSGFAQVALVRLGLLSPDAIDRTADALEHICTPVPEGMAQLGDMAFYGGPNGASHVMVCLGGGVVLGARGGGSHTNGDNPQAFVQLEPLHYRSDLRSIGRPLK